MWMGELITQRGIGNGMSLLIFASVVSRLPANFGAVRAESGTIAMLGVALMFIGVLVAIVFVEQGQRRIPVQFAKRQVGRKQYGGQNTYIPLKVNASGVIPIIFANSMLYLPVMISSVLPAEAERRRRRQLGLPDAGLHRPDTSGGAPEPCTWARTAS